MSFSSERRRRLEAQAADHTGSWQRSDFITDSRSPVSHGVLHTFNHVSLYDYGSISIKADESIMSHLCRFCPSPEFTRAQSEGVVLCLRPNEGLPAAASCSATRWGLQCEYCTSRNALQKVINGAGFHPQPVMFGPATTFI